MTRRGGKPWFERVAGAPAPLRLTVARRVRFNECDPMGIVWFGRYALYFEEGAAELGRRCGLSYLDFMEANLRAPIVQFHVDYLKPLYLDEEFTIRTALVWNEGARLNSEFTLVKADGSTAASAYTVQLFTGPGGDSIAVTPPLLERCRRRWEAGEFRDLQS